VLPLVSKLICIKVFPTQFGVCDNEILELAVQTLGCHLGLRKLLISFQDGKLIFKLIWENYSN
jgi:hypothetical protein